MLLLENESCGGHFREEHQTKEGEAVRRIDDRIINFVSAWEYIMGSLSRCKVLHKEKLEYNDIEVKNRSYK